MTSIEQASATDRGAAVNRHICATVSLCLLLLPLATIRAEDDATVAATRQQDARAIPVEGQSVRDVINGYRRQGVPFAYSTMLVSDDLRVVTAPSPGDPVSMVTEILQPYGLTVQFVEGLYVVIRMQRSSKPARVEDTRPRDNAPVMAEVTVSASRYELLRELLDSPSFISQRAILEMPDLGEDPIRAVQRLPGNAASGASAKSHLRGAGQDDTGLILNGQRLLDPFHVRDYHNLFSAIDARAINGIEVFTGGFPAQYGDRIGGLVLIDTVTPDTERYTEIGLSVYNTSFLSAGSVANGDIEWLVSARRGNLDLVIDKEFGEPSYNDVFAEIGANFSDRTRITVNGLVANDRVIIVTETDPSEREESRNDTRNAQFWINWEQHWTENVQSYTTLSTSAFRSDRVGGVNDPEEIVGFVADRRDIELFGITQDWTANVNHTHRLSWGIEYRNSRGRYDYSSSVDYFGLFQIFADLPDSIARDIETDVSGDSFGVYLSDRWQVGRKTAAEVGIRWDRQDYTDGESQLSPRLSLLHAMGPKTDLRVSWGRYYQSQGINELQVEDGISTFFPAQRADETIVGIEHRFGGDYSLRVEAYWKEMDRLRPRFENQLDPLAVLPELKPDRIRVDPDRADARGVEFSLGRNGTGPVSWWATYVLAEVEDDIDGADVPRSWDQRHALQFGLAWSNKRWNVGVIASTHSGWPKTILEVDPASDPEMPLLQFGPRNSERFTTFATLDLRVSYRSRVHLGSLTTFFELSNATNRDNPCCVDFGLEEDPDGNVFLRQDDEFWFPLLPAVGILWEF